MSSQTLIAKSATSRTTITRSRLRILLTVDALGCVALGLVALAATGSVAHALSAGSGVLVVGGATLLVYAVEALLVARRPSRGGLLALVVMNGAFAVGAGAVALSGGLTTVGLVVAAVLATVSVVVAELLLVARRDVASA